MFFEKNRAFIVVAAILTMSACSASGAVPHGTYSIANSLQQGGAVPRGTYGIDNVSQQGIVHAHSASLFAPARQSSGFKLLYSFKGGADGEYPFSALVAVDGGSHGAPDLYGTTFGIGCRKRPCAPGSAGTVYDITTSGAEKVLYSFKAVPDADAPTAPLIDVNGTLYGTTQLGGGFGHGSLKGTTGTVFSVSTGGSERVLYSFQGGSAGAGPQASLVARNGMLYGTTRAGGGSACQWIFAGCGTIFAISTSGQHKVLHQFTGPPSDGSWPITPLIALNGKFYGMTWTGGSGKCTNGCGTVYEVSASGKEHVLHSFKGAPDGENLQGALVVVNGLLYGTTTTGGTSQACPSFGGCGTFFSINPTTGREHVIYSFNQDAPSPNGLLLFKGLLYGTSQEISNGYHPCSQCGTIFDITTSGRERVLYTFTGSSDGAGPSELITDGQLLYGTTGSGGADNFGTVFAQTP